MENNSTGIQKTIKRMKNYLRSKEKELYFHNLKNVL